ncbi:alpha/beta hydrolase [Streptomyces bathyalis]|uniref:Alpha/beta hydrolase n=2 Tax=Streptomyces bathyalis TaxID=2710756 RepID=A0A7T1WQN3_9ACTN|nr:alpha/beta hydrolase [Streptomyces bathyalis]QPP07118.1 alpha/beta hydrolase [Streptomyces bathyalis]
MRIRRIAPPLLVVGVTAAFVPGLAPTEVAAAEPLGQFESQRPSWHRCDPEMPAKFQCATIKVPLDYDRPTGKKIKLAISRIKTAVPGKRHGAMLFNPGGPGGEGLSMPLYMKESLPKKIRDQYDLIGFDPRGVGKSSPVTCDLSDAEQNFERPYKPETFNSDVKWARTVAKKCRDNNGDKLPHITTRNTARDMDVIRGVLGEKKISYLGISYGTYLGAVYTQMFPERSDRFVLDSAVDPARVWRGMIQIWASGTEPAFTRWTKWTAERHSTYKLGKTSAEVRKTFWALIARADQKPIPYEDDKLNGDEIRSMLRSRFFSPKEAATVVADLKEAADGGPKARSSAAADEITDNMTASFWSVVCGDTSAWPRDPEQYRRDAIRDKAKYPLYGDFGSNITPCAFWNKPAEPVTDVNNGVGTLTVQNQWDSQTPLASGRGMHQALKGSRMVYVRGGEGHGVYDSDPKACANRAVNAYLSTGKLPAKDVTCKAANNKDRDANEHPPSAPRRVPGLPDRF